MSGRLYKWNRLAGKFAFNARDWRYELDGLEDAGDEIDLLTRRLLRQPRQRAPKRGLPDSDGRPPQREAPALAGRTPFRSST